MCIIGYITKPVSNIDNDVINDEIMLKNMPKLYVEQKLKM